MFAGKPPARKIAVSISARRISEVSGLPDQRSFFPCRFRCAQNFHRARHSFFGDSESAPHQAQFLFGLRFAFRPEKSVGRSAVESCSLPVRARNRAGNSPAQRRSARRVCAKNAPALFRKPALSCLFPAPRVRICCKDRNSSACAVLRRAIDFKIAQDQRAFAVLFQKNKRIGREEVRRIKHVRDRVRSQRRSVSFGSWIYSSCFLTPIPKYVIPSRQRNIA